MLVLVLLLESIISDTLCFKLFIFERLFVINKKQDKMNVVHNTST